MLCTRLALNKQSETLMCTTTHHVSKFKVVLVSGQPSATIQLHLANKNLVLLQWIFTHKFILRNNTDDKKRNYISPKTFSIMRENIVILTWSNNPLTRAVISRKSKTFRSYCSKLCFGIHSINTNIINLFQSLNTCFYTRVLAKTIY